MTKYILTHGELETDIPLPWEYVPEEAYELIDRDYISKSLYFSSEDGLQKQSTIFLRKVDSFKRGMKKFELEEGIMVGV